MSKLRNSSITATPRHCLVAVCRLYVPTMLVIGLHGWVLPPGAILVCDLFVYSEFLIHPVLLLAASRRMRREIGRGLKTTVLVIISFQPRHFHTTFETLQSVEKRVQLSLLLFIIFTSLRR